MISVATTFLDRFISLTSKNLVVLLILFSVCISLFAMSFSWYSWVGVKNRELTYLSSISELGSTSMFSYYHDYESGLMRLKNELLSTDWPHDVDKPYQFIRGFQLNHSEIRSVYISLPDGQLLLSSEETGSAWPESNNLSHELAVLSFKSGSDFDISRPVYDQLLKEWVIPLRYAIRDKAGSLNYIVTAALPLSTQQTLWQDVYLPDNAEMGLIRDDLFTLSRVPMLIDHDQKILYSEARSGVVATYIRQKQFPERGQGGGLNTATGFDSLFTFTRLQKYPLTLFVTIPVQGVYQKFIKQLQPFFILVAVFFISTIVTGLFIHRRQMVVDAERKEAKRRIKLGKERFNLAMKGANDGLWDWNLETDEVYYSPRWKSMLGYSDDEVEHVLKSGLNLIHPLDQQKVMKHVQLYIEGSINNFEIEMRMKHKQGGYVNVLSRAFLLRREPDNTPVRLIGTHVDMTEHYQSEFRERSRNEVLEKVTNGESIDAILNYIVNLIEQEVTGIICSIQLIDSDGKSLTKMIAPGLPVEYRKTYQLDGFNASHTPIMKAIEEGGIVIENNITESSYADTFKNAANMSQLIACWAKPVINRYSERLGVVAMYHTEPCCSNKIELFILDLATDLSRIAIEQNQSNEELQLASLVYRNSHEAMAVTTCDDIIISVNPAFSKLTGYEPEEIIGQSHKILKSDHHDHDFYNEFYSTLNKTGQWKGEFWNRRKNGDVYVEKNTISTIFNADGSVHRYVSLSSDITEKKQTEELIWQQANYDALTKLPNRRMFQDRLKRDILKSERTGLSLALMFLDLDNFKEINDSLGHDMGDLLLKEVARRISSCVREIDLVARLGGDEFTVLLGDLDETTVVERVSSSILSELEQPVKLNDDTVYITASIGITVFPRDADSLDGLLKTADHAMYTAKSHGRNRSCYFTPSMQEQARSRIKLLTDLRSALSQNQFEMYYQPIVDLHTGRVLKAEALIRWHHPVEGLITPCDFIPVTEESGLIVEIGDWAFHAVINQLVIWSRDYDNKLQISINKSPVQFHNSVSASADWVDYMNQSGVKGDSIAIEITEGVLLDAAPEVTDQLIKFRDAGIQVALDDFGTGYSSLAYLKKFDIDYLKIDQAFIRNLTKDSDDMALCEAITVMAHKLGIKVVAEGVETEVQRDLLLGAGSDYAQGFLFSKPLSASDFEKHVLAKSIYH